MTRTEEHKNRWGKVLVTSERLDSQYTRYTYEGLTDAVIAEVGQRLHSTTQCYEFMFRVDSLQPLPGGVLRAFCTYNNYAGD